MNLLNGNIKTTLPTIFGAFGVFLIGIGIGIELKVIDTSLVSNLQALVLGVIFIILSVLIYIVPIIKDWSPSSHKSTKLVGKPKRKDPFFRYYFVVAFLIVSLFWISVFRTHGKIQFIIVLLQFGFEVVLVTILLIMRYVIVRSYIQDTKLEAPIGLLIPVRDYFPYFILIGTTILGLFLLANNYTKNNAVHYSYIITSLIIFISYFAACRVVWEIIDIWARHKISKKKQDMEADKPD